MSKITDLRRQAADAKKAGDWKGAVKLYERICGLDSSNPSFRNELGDVFIKIGDIPRAIEQFAKAVELYSAVGLSNNAVAVHKKILRFDVNQLDSHWGLGEIRRRQGLESEAVGSFLEFLRRGDQISTQSRQAFLDRCATLLETMPEDLQILGELEDLYGRWEMSRELARVLLCKAGLARSEGHAETAGNYIARAQELAGTPSDLPEWASLHAMEEDAGAEVDVQKARFEPGMIDLPHDSEELSSDDGEEDEFIRSGNLSSEPSASSFGDIELDLPLGDSQPLGGFGADEATGEAPNPAPTPAEDPPGETVFEIDPADADFDFGTIELSDAETPASPDSTPTDSPPPHGGINLLDEILADDDLDLHQDQQQQVDTIVQDLGGQIASSLGADDGQSQYELGMVYLEMDLMEQALAAFEGAAHEEETRLRAQEMRGTCLQKLGRWEESIGAFEDGLAQDPVTPRDHLGLYYGMGVSLEQLGRVDDAVDCYREVVAVDEGFVDARARLDRLEGSHT